MRLKRIGCVYINHDHGYSLFHNQPCMQCGVQIPAGQDHPSITRFDDNPGHYPTRKPALSFGFCSIACRQSWRKSNRLVA